MRTGVMGLLSIACCGCAPQFMTPESSYVGVEQVSLPEAALPSQSDSWQRAIYFAGFSVRYPGDAGLTYPQGIDSSTMIIRGQGFELFFDNYGPFSGRETIEIGGRPANIATRGAPNFRSSIWEIEAPAEWTLMRCSDTASGTCKPLAARIVASSRCTSYDSCATVEQIMATAQFAAPPF